MNLLARVVRFWVELSVRQASLCIAIVVSLGLIAAMAATLVDVRLDARSLIASSDVYGDRKFPAGESIDDSGTEDSLVVVLVRPAADISEADVRRQVESLSQNLYGVLDALSAAEFSIRQAYGVSVPRLIGDELTRSFWVPSRDGQADVESFLRDTRLLSPDGKANAVYVTVPDDVDRVELLQAVQRIKRNSAGPCEVFIGGNAAAQGALGRSVMVDLVRVVPAMLIVVFACLTIAYRSVWPGILALAEAGVSLATAFAILAALGWPVYITTLTLPLIVLIIVTCDNVYALNRVAHTLRNPANSIADAYVAIAPVVIATSGTTVIGFGALLFSGLGPHRVFGLLAAVSIAVSAVLMFTLSPAVVSLMRARIGGLRILEFRSLRRLAVKRQRLPLPGLQRSLVRVLGVLVALAVPILILRIDVTDSWTRNLPPDHDVVIGNAQIDAHLGGATQLSLEVTSGSADYFLNASNMRALGNVAAGMIRGEPAVGSVVSIKTFLDHGYRMLMGDREEFVEGDVEWALAMLDTVVPIERERWLDRSNQHAQLAIALRHASSSDVEYAVEKARALVHESLPGTTLTAKGDAWFTALAIDEVVTSQVTSVAAALVMDAVFLLVLLRSWRTTGAVIAPIIIAIPLTFAAMSALRFPLGIATSMFAAMGLGLGVDFSVHFVMHARSSRSRLAISRAMTEAFPAILLAVLCLVAGLACLQLSVARPNRELGILLSISLALSAVSTVAFGPWFLRRTA